MRLRTVLTATAAIMAAGALALAPAAQASSPTGGPIASVTGASGAITGVLKSANVDMTTALGVINLNCPSGTAGGGVTVGNLTPNAALNFTAINLSCDNWMPGTTVSMAVDSRCNGVGGVRAVMNDNNVHLGLTDTGTGTKFDAVDGTASMQDNSGDPCVKVTYSTGCVLWIKGTVPVRFHEAVKTGNWQDLVLNGSGLQVAGGSFAPNFLCFGAVAAGSGLTLNNVTFNLKRTATPYAAIDFHP